MATLEELMWDLDTDDKIKNVTWWWWWWLFFIRNKKDPKRWKQLMILWSIKDCKKIKVMDHIWKPTGTISKKDNSLEFPGMVCAWFYDGKRMRDPYLIHEKVFQSSWQATGKTKPLGPEVVRSTKGSKGKKVTKILNYKSLSDLLHIRILITTTVRLKNVRNTNPTLTWAASFMQVSIMKKY